MKIALQYLNDQNGKVRAVQLPLNEWEKVINRLKKYEQTLKIKSDLKEAFAEVVKLRGSKTKAPLLKDFLNEL